MRAVLHIADVGRSEWEVDLLHIHYHQNGLWTNVTCDGESHDVNESFDDIDGMVQTALARTTKGDP